MANPVQPFGFMPIKSDGKEVRCTKYTKGTGIIYAGDVVKLNNAGAVVIGTAGASIIGIAAEYRASAETEIYVYDDPSTEFVAAADDALAAADVGLNIDITATTGDTVLKRSKHDLDVATVAVTATLQFRLLGLWNKGENAFGANAIMRVKPNNHQLAPNTVGL